MKVTTGTARGRNLAAPQGLSTRPTSDMLKQALFNIIQFEVEGSTVLDLFAGSGQLGIEALSRGAKQAVFVDKSREAQEIIRQNLLHTGLQASAQVVAMEASSFLAGTKLQFDLAFLDPPYQQDILPSLLPVVAGKMSSFGVILCETEKGELLPETAGDFEKKKEYRYGKSQLTVYRKKDEPDQQPE